MLPRRPPSGDHLTNHCNMVDRKQVSETRARVAARRVGLQAIKSRRRDPITHRGGFILINPNLKILTHGEGFSLSAEDVLNICREIEKG